MFVCERGFHLSMAFQQADAETCFKEAVIMLLQNAALIYSLTGLRKPPGCLCAVPCCNAWVEASSHTWISGVSTLH